MHLAIRSWCGMIRAGMKETAPILKSGYGQSCSIAAAVALVALYFVLVWHS